MKTAVDFIKKKQTLNAKWGIKKEGVISLYIILSTIQLILLTIGGSFLLIALKWFDLGNTFTIFAILFVETFVFTFSIEINRYKHHLKLLNLGKSLRRKVSNTKVKEYVTYLEKRKSVRGSPNTWGSLRETYRQVCSNEDIDYDLKVQLYEALNVKGTRGIVYPRKSKGHYNENVEEKIRQAGEEGERQVEHALDWLDSSRFKVFSDIRLPFGGKSQQFDTIIVGDNGVFNIETKNFVGDLYIDEEGNWYRIIGDKKSGTENVNFQVIRHNKVLGNLLEDRIPIIDLIVWTNVESILEGIEYSPTRIIKTDQLVGFIEGYDQEKKLSEKEINFAIEAIENSILKSVKNNN